jgi:cysteine synthase
MSWPERGKLYDRLEHLIGKTPLVKLERMSPDGQSEIFMKLECRNPTGSHYDRIILELLRRKEEAGEIEKGTVLLDTTTGNSGAALAWLSRVLGFECNLIIPEDAPAARIQQIASYGARIEFSPAGQYTDGLIATLQSRIRSWTEHDSRVLLNHASVIVAPAAAMRNLGEEVRDQFAADHPGEELTHLVVALGNGASVNMAYPLKEEECTIVGFEPIRAPKSFLQMYDEAELERRYGTPPEPSLSHGLWGTGAGIDRGFKWPLMRSAWNLLDDIMLVSEDEWEMLGVRIADEEGLHVGRSSAARVAVAQRIVREADGPVNVLCVAYDPAWKYLGDGR